MNGAGQSGDRTYQLHIHLPTSLTLSIGRLGEFVFPAGFYVYTGSARRAMAARLARHLAAEKKKRWHIDYLLAGPDVRVTHVATHTEPECMLNQATPGEIVAPGFGAGDCRSGCGSHLKYLGVAPGRK